jgi:hypothetical protein
MRADRVEVTWDTGKREWLTRIQIGDEVIRRFTKASKDTDEQTLRQSAQQAVKDEGYDLDPQQITISR